MIHKKLFLWLTLALVLASLTGASYLLFSKFLADRDRALSFRGVPAYQNQNQTIRDGKEVKTYTQKDLEEARRKGQVPQGAQPYTPPHAQTSGQDAVQRSLKTLEEINKINQMNQRLMEQQQKMQKQQQ